MQQIQTSQDFTISSLITLYKTWYIICLTRANKHFEAQYQLNKWATSLGLHSSEEEDDFSEQEAGKGYPTLARYTKCK